MKKTLYGAVVALLVLSCGCTRRVYIPLEHLDIRRDTVRMVSARIDSVVRIDSVNVARRGDTVYHDRWHYRLLTRHSLDTVERVSRDTIVEERRVSVPSEKRREPGKFFWGLLGGAVVAAAALLLWRRR